MKLLDVLNAPWAIDPAKLLEMSAADKDVLWGRVRRSR